MGKHTTTTAAGATIDTTSALWLLLVHNNNKTSVDAGGSQARAADMSEPAAFCHTFSPEKTVFPLKSSHWKVCWENGTVLRKLF